MNILGTLRPYSVPGPALGAGNRDDEAQVSTGLALAPGGQLVEALSRRRAGHALRPPGPPRRGLSREKKEPWTRLRVSGYPTQGCCVCPVPCWPFHSRSAQLPDAGFLLGRNLLSVLHDRLSAEGLGGNREGSVQPGHHGGASSCQGSALLANSGDTAEFYAEVPDNVRPSLPLPGIHGK